MLDNAIKSQLRDIFSQLEAHYTLKIYVHQHEQRVELVDMLEDVASTSENISCETTDGNGLSFSVLKNGADTGIIFRTVPGGHEFTSLIMALLNADGKGKNLPDEFIQNRIKAIKEKIHLTTYLSLSCTNCPDVVQALNIMALLNPNITHEAVDGAINTEEVERLKVQAVPTVFANGELLHVGRGTIGELLDKLEERFTINSNVEEYVKEYDVIVAGGGPAGTTAALYSARKGLRVALIAERVGGQVNETVAIENIPSVVSTTGTHLANDLRNHLSQYNIEVLENRHIETVAVENGTKVITIKGGEVCKAPALIIATGAKWRRLNIPGEEQYIGHGVAFCPHCDGPFYQDKEVAVIGGGNSGVEAAIDLAGICKKVTLIEFADTLRADNVLQERLRSIPNVEIFTNTQTTSIEGNGSNVTGITVKERNNGNEQRIALNGVFVQIGLSANSNLFKDIVETNRIGEIITDKNGRTSLKGVYAAGDVTDVSYKQIVIAMGEGAKSALAAFEDKMRGEL